MPNVYPSQVTTYPPFNTGGSGSGAITTYAGTVYVDSVNGSDANNGQAEFFVVGSSTGPVKTLPHAFSLAGDGYLIQVDPLSNFPIFNITVTTNVTLYSPMIGPVPGSNVQNQPFFGGTFTVATANGGSNTGRLYCYNLNFYSASGAAPFIDVNTSDAGTPWCYLFNCGGSKQPTGVISNGLTVSCIQNKNGQLFMDSCSFSVSRQDSATTGIGAAINVTGSSWCNTYIKNSKLNAVHLNDDFSSYSIYTDNTATSPQAVIATENCRLTVSNSNATQGYFIGRSASTTIVTSTGDTWDPLVTGTVPAITLVKDVNNTSGYVSVSGVSFNYDTGFGTILSDSAVTMASTAISTDKVTVTGFFRTAGNVSPVIAPGGGIDTIEFNVINGALKKISSSQFIISESTYTVLPTDWGDGAYITISGGTLTLTASSLMLPPVAGLLPSVYITVANASGFSMNIVAQGSDSIQPPSLAVLPSGQVTRIYYEGISAGIGYFRVG